MYITHSSLFIFNFFSAYKHVVIHIVAMQYVLPPLLLEPGLTRHQTSADTCEQLSYQHTMYCDTESSQKFSTKRYHSA